VQSAVRYYWVQFHCDCNEEHEILLGAVQNSGPPKETDEVFRCWGEKFWGVTSDVLRDIGRGVQILIKKTNYIIRLETVRRIW
jgi:hypothetical protein